MEFLLNFMAVFFGIWFFNKKTITTIKTKRRYYLLFVLACLPIYFFLIKKAIAINITLQYLTFKEWAGFFGGYGNLIILNVLDFAIYYCMYLYLLIPPVIIRLLRKKPFLSWKVWIILVLLNIILAFWSTLASLALDIPIPNSPFVPVIFDAVFASYFILSFPAGEQEQLGINRPAE